MKTNIKKLAKDIQPRHLPSGPGKHSGQFGHVWPLRRRFPKGNYYGYESREAWAAAFKDNQMTKRIIPKIRAVATKTHLEIQERARQIADKAMDRLEDILNADDAGDTAVIQAAVTVLERGYGKASQTNINANLDTNAKASDIDTPELRKRIESALKRVEGAASGVPEEGESKDGPPNIRKYH